MFVKRCYYVIYENDSGVGNKSNPESVVVEGSDLLIISPSISQLQLGVEENYYHSYSSASENLDSSLLNLESHNLIVDRWGININSDDDKLISRIRRKFSLKIKKCLTKLFLKILNDKSIIVNSSMESTCSWYLVSHEILPIAIKSVEKIMKDQYEEIDKALSMVRVVDIYEYGVSSLHMVRVITNDEKNDLMERAKVSINKRLHGIINFTWRRLAKFPKRRIDRKYRNGISGINLSCKDKKYICSIRRKFSSRIRSRLCDKFNAMISDKHQFSDGSIIGVFTWSKVSKELFPIAKVEVKDILEDEIKELYSVISRARIVVNSETDRFISDDEKFTVLTDLKRIVDRSLMCLCSKSFGEVLSSLGGNFSDSVASVVSDDVGAVYGGVKGGDFRINFYFEDDVSIFRVKKKFYAEIKRCIINKFTEIVCEGRVDLLPWVKVSTKLLPIIKKEIYPIMERKRVEIGSILSKSRASFCKLGGDSIIRRLTYKERCMSLSDIMRKSYRYLLSNFGRLWSTVIDSKKYSDESGVCNFIECISDEDE
ncbi:MULTISPECIES: hypothetical protein [Candidatus Ichthyocystis]|uniref:Uncharacterized protein n=1 Tax=Candidatus Ichthyocystis hellenicum TaxID=1561003 RepID=A0A0S4M1M0_9BURK|nr:MULTISPECIES: hypothetical protein [Ichthyocystis]CUT17671.1 hypothetical protein Ark11_0848 [Candidatus Ichthyocystis hellenicum]